MNAAMSSRTAPVVSPSGATIASDEPGMIARSPGSSASKAGTRGFITRTQAISAARSVGPGSTSGRAVGKIAAWTSWRLATDPSA